MRRLQVETLTSTVAAILGSPDETEALVTDLFTDFFFRYVDQLRESRAIPSYLQIMAVRRARRLKERWQREIAVEPNALTDDPRERLDSELDDHASLPGLERCLKGLTDRARSLLKLHYGHELSYAAINADCGSVGSVGAAFGPTTNTKTYYFAPIVPGAYVLAIESSSVSEQGSFTLEIEEVGLPTNGTCSHAQPVTLTSGSAVVKGDNRIGATDEFRYLACGTTNRFSGPQLYYQVNLLAGHSYWFELYASFSAYAYVFPASTNCDVSEIEHACASGGHVFKSELEGGVLCFTPPSDGVYMIAVDSTSSYQVGEFTLYIDEITATNNLRCPNPA